VPNASPLENPDLLADRTAGLRVSEKSNWTGHPLDIARSDWTDVRGRSDFARLGVCVLKEQCSFSQPLNRTRTNSSAHLCNTEFFR
jgi:hypothetical protein